MPSSASSTLSLHDALPISLDVANNRVFLGCRQPAMVVVLDGETGREITNVAVPQNIDDLYYDAKRKRLYASCGEGFIAVIRQTDRKSTRLNSSHLGISYAVLRVLHSFPTRRSSDLARRRQQPRLPRLPAACDGRGLGRGDPPGDHERRCPAEHRRPVLRREAQAAVCLLR